MFKEITVNNLNQENHPVIDFLSDDDEDIDKNKLLSLLSSIANLVLKVNVPNIQSQLNFLSRKLKYWLTLWKYNVKQI